MKWINYQFVSGTINKGTEEEPVMEDILSPKSMTYSEKNLEIAKAESYNSEYTITAAATKRR